jgi:hypothetical protein
MVARTLGLTDPHTIRYTYDSNKIESRHLRVIARSGSVFRDLTQSFIAIGCRHRVLRLWAFCLAAALLLRNRSVPR